MWSSLQQILPKIANKFQVKRTLDAIGICRDFRSLASRHLPGDSAKHVTPRSYVDRTLTVAVSNSAWAQQLHMRGHLIREEINRKNGQEAISRIRIVVADGPSEGKDAAPPSGNAPY